MKHLLLLHIFLLSAFASVGTISAVRGEVTIERGSESIKAAIGNVVNEGDTIHTTKRGRAQIILKDQSTITVGRNSSFAVTSFIFDIQQKKAEVLLEYKQGLFKTITGKIGKIAPKKFSIKTKNSTIGIRGTHIVNSIDPVTGVEQIACTKGAITVATATNAVDLQANQVVQVSSSAGIGKVQRFSRKMRSTMQQSDTTQNDSETPSQNDETPVDETETTPQDETTVQETPTTQTTDDVQSALSDETRDSTTTTTQQLTTNTANTVNDQLQALTETITQETELFQEPLTDEKLRFLNKDNDVVDLRNPF